MMNSRTRRIPRRMSRSGERSGCGNWKGVGPVLSARRTAAAHLAAPLADQEEAWGIKKLP